MKKIIVVSSGKGGVGKTTSAINLGAAINYFGKEVLIIDANLTTPNVGIHLGSPEVPIHLNHILQGKASIEEAIYEHESGLKIMPASLSIGELKKLSYDKLKKYKKEFLEHADYIIIDSAAGLGNEALSAMELADELIIITNPEMPAVTDALKTIKVAESLKKPIKGVIVTRVKRSKTEMRPDVVKEMLEAPILGMIPEDSEFQKSLALKDAIVNLFPKSKPARAYKEIAARILEIEYDSTKEKESIWEKISKAFSR